jgi:hypothetical protein
MFMGYFKELLIDCEDKRITHINTLEKKLLNRINKINEKISHIEIQNPVLFEQVTIIQENKNL